MSRAFAAHGAGERPSTPDESYGVPEHGGTLIDWNWVAEQLTQPHDWDDGGLYLATPSAVLAWREMNTATRWRFER